MGAEKVSMNIVVVGTTVQPVNAVTIVAKTNIATIQLMVNW